MQKQKENLFREKFRLLNSQENSEDIIWSLSDSSEYEEPLRNEQFKNITNRNRILKRKRKKKTTSKISNLNITVLSTSQDSKEVQTGELSPILVSQNNQKSFHLSPILTSFQTCRNRSASPILPLKNIHQKSPILASESASLKPTGSIKKKLFSNRKSEYEGQVTTTVKTEINSDYDIEDDNLTCQSSVPDLTHRRKEENTSKSKIELISKVKSFFNNHFSSENSSQNSQSISDIPTQRNSSKTSDEMEILTCKTETISRNNSTSIKSIKQESLSDSENSFYAFNKRKRKIKYKKDGLAYRLCNLLKKQNACLSLWHHERYLAANSNFILPKEKNTVFRIQKVNFNYGCYLLEVVDLNEDEYLVLINSCYVSDTILCDSIIKVYEPFKVVQYNEDFKLVINVCRFQCSQYKV